MSLNRSDNAEKRVKCNICGFDLSYPEFMFLDGKCLFHAESGMTVLKNMSFLGYIRLLWHDYRVMKGKLAMQARDLSEVDWQACVSEVAEELHEVDSDGLKKLVGYMKNHSGVYEPVK
jgi:hypothetical protein